MLFLLHVEIINTFHIISRYLFIYCNKYTYPLLFSLFSDYPDNMNYFKNYGKNKEEIMKNEKFIRHAKERVFGTFDRTINSLDDQKEISNITAWLAKVHGPKGVKTTDFLVSIQDNLYIYMCVCV